MSLRRRFLLLRALRWFPTGLLIPVLLLFVLGRGITIAEFGMASAAQAGVILLLELPTGGLADVVGARPVLILANLADIASIGLLLVADSFAVLVVVWALQGVYRSLESGPLEAWYVSAALDVDPDTDIGGDMAQAGMVLSLAIALGSLTSSGLVLAAPTLGVEPLMLPIAIGLALRLLDLGAVAVLMTDDSSARAEERLRFGATMAEVPTVVADAARLVMRSRVLPALLGVELLWGTGMVGFETLFPPRLSEVVDDAARAASLLGPVGTAAWLLAAAGSALVPHLTRRVGPEVTAALLRVAQGVSVLALAVLAGPVGLITFYLVTLMVHGAGNAVHSSLLHANVESAHRTTMLSANSMAGHLGGGIGSIILGLVAANIGLTTAISAAAAVLVVAAPLYLVGRSEHRVQPSKAA